jgi:DNA-binding NtrC family response regulator
MSEELYFIAGSPVMRRLRMQAELLSQTDVPVLITGEPGSGKSAVARLIHSLSIRSSYPYIQVGCALLTADLLETELFGYNLPSSNGRQAAMPGKFEECARGTILLNDVEAIPDAVQRRLLKMLEMEEVYRGQSQNHLRADARILAATSGDLELALEERRIGQELFYRLSVVELRVPSLRERHDEVPVLLGYLMNRLSRRYGVPAPRLSRSLLDACQQYTWPGNLSEFENFAKRFLAHGDEGAALQELYSHVLADTHRKIDGQVNVAPQSFGPYSVAQHHPPASTALQTSEHRSPLKLLVRNAKGEAERGAITDALECTQWNRKAAARLLNVSYRAILYKIQQYGLTPEPLKAMTLASGANGRQAKKQFEAGCPEFRKCTI